MSLADTTKTTVELILFAATVAGGIGFLIAQVRKADISSLNQSNEILRKLLEDQKVQMNGLGERVNESDKKIANLEGQIKVMSEQNNGMKSLITDALANYFEEHPEVAEKFVNQLK